MVSHRRRRTILTALGLYTFAALFIGYFAVNAFTGNHGLRAQADLDQQMASMQGELKHLKAEHALWERRVALLRPDRIDPDMLDERARALLGLVDPRDLTLLLPARQHAGVIHRMAGNFQPNSGCFPQFRPAASRFRPRAI